MVNENDELYEKPGYEVVRMKQQKGKDEFWKTMRRRSRRYASLLDLLIFDWPDADEILYNLYLYVSDSIHRNKDPVIYHIVEQALDSYNDAVFNRDKKKLDDPVRISIFIESLIKSTCSYFEVSIVDERGEAWSVDSGERFVDWLRNHSGDLKIYDHQHQDEASLRGMLYTLVTCESVKKVIKRSGYEDAVLAGSVAAGR